MEDSTRCRVCSAQATGFHFDAQSCSACAAFFRRTVSLDLQRNYQCITGLTNCQVHYAMVQMCRSCRFEKCLQSGMKTAGVQPRRATKDHRRTFCTKSGLKRNKRFAVVKPTTKEEVEQIEEVIELTKNNDKTPQMDIKFFDAPEHELSVCVPSVSASSSTSSTSSATSPCLTTPRMQPLPSREDDVLSCLVREEMRLGERRRIIFCERQVEKLLGKTKFCPYTRDDIKPLKFRHFRKSIRTHILWIYEWLQVWPDYEQLHNNDKVSFLRKLVLFHTILDPVYISIQIGYPDRFVMQNGGYVSCIEGCDEGWQDEKEISGSVKRMIYQPLLNKIMGEIIPPMLQLDLSFEEFVALKAFVSWQGSLPNVSLAAREVMKKQLDAVTTSLHRHYTVNGIDAAERLGSIILLLSSIFSTGLDFVESHRQIEFFDLWTLDSLLRQFLNLDSIMEKNNAR